MVYFFRYLFFLGLLVLLVACATSSPNVTYYTTHAAVDMQQVVMESNELSIAIGPAEFPNYLQRNQIVTRKKNRLHVEEFHRWGASFERTVLSTLGENIRSLINTPRIVIYPAIPRFDIDYRIVMDFLHFEGALGGDVALNVRWMVLDTSGKNALHIKQTTLSQSTANRSYDALIDAYNLLLTELAIEMATAVNKLHTAQ